MIKRRLRAAAYGLCVRDGHLLLARFVSSRGPSHYWTLPGGGIDHAEDPYDAVVREVAEETGYAVSVTRLLGVDSRTWRLPDRVDLHSIGVFYEVGIVGGELRHEVGGSTDLAEWVALERIEREQRAAVVDIGLALLRQEPATGHVDPVVPGGLVHH
jgi:8-oxo-dGTP diphosphatase